MYSDKSSKNNIMFIQISATYNKDKLIVEKAKQIINELYTKKISYSTLMQKVKNRYNHLTLQQKQYIKNKIVDENINSANSNIQSSFFCYPTIQLEETNNQQNINSLVNNAKNILNELNKLKDCAIAMSVATAAQWIIAAAEACIWFIGWIEVGFTIAAAIADTAATTFAWLTYNQAYNPINNAVGGIEALPSTVFLWNDIKNLKGDMEDFANKNLEHNLDRLRVSMFAAEGANDADSWADSADQSTIILINSIFTVIDVIDTALDATMIIAGLIGVTW